MNYIEYLLASDICQHSLFPEVAYSLDNFK